MHTFFVSSVAAFNGDASAGNDVMIVAEAGGLVSFDLNNSAGTAGIVLQGSSSGTGSGGYASFSYTSTADQAAILIRCGTARSGTAGMLKFFQSATAGNSVITIAPAALGGATVGLVEFYGTSTAGAATIIGNGGFPGTKPGAGGLIFAPGSNPGSANVMMNGGTFDGAVGGLAAVNSTAATATFTNGGGSRRRSDGN